jgi:ribosomal protein S4E
VKKIMAEILKNRGKHGTIVEIRNYRENQGIIVEIKDNRGNHEKSWKSVIIVEIGHTRRNQDNRGNQE